MIQCKFGSFFYDHLYVPEFGTYGNFIIAKLENDRLVDMDEFTINRCIKERNKIMKSKLDDVEIIF